MTGKKENIYSLLDTGADRDYISDKVAIKLGLKVDRRWSKIYGVNSVTDGMGKQANLIFKTFNQSYEATVNDALVGDFTGAEGDEAPSKRDLSRYHHLDDVEFINIDSKVEALLGSGHIQTWQGWGRTKYGAKGHPLAMRTAWGWTIAGLAGTKDSSGARVAFLSAEDQLLKDDVKKVFCHDFPREEVKVIKRSRIRSTSAEGIC